MSSVADLINASAKSIKVKGECMHYIEQGTGNPVVFIHGMPTSSYLWRNIIPGVSKHARCIAVDLIGMGKSSKPVIKYTAEEHLKYFTGFIEALKLKNITLVMHGWGSVIGFSYAMQHPENIRQMAFLESYLKLPSQRKDIPLPVQELAKLMQHKEQARKLIINENYFVEKLLQMITLDKLTPEEIARYRAPFANPKDRELLWHFALEQPYINQKSPAANLIKQYSVWLQNTPIPKLMMYCVPGLLTPISVVQWAKKHLPHLTLVELGHGLHFLPETCSKELVHALNAWV